MSLRIVCCVEAGRLEAETVLMCESLRRFGGGLAETPVSAYRPRRGEALGDATVARLEELAVDLIEDELNAEHAFHPIANKLYAAADAERRNDEEVIAVLDSDSVFVAAPADLELGPGIDATAAPAGKVSEGTTGPGHDHEDYWQGLYALAGVTDPPWTETALRGRRMRGYWNSGLVAVRRDAGLFAEWFELFRRLLDEGRLPPSERIDSLDQISLALVFGRRPDRVRTLPWSYNYRITRRGRYGGPAGRAQMSDLVHIHYMRSFYVEGFLDRVEPPFEQAEQLDWLSERLPLEPRVVLGEDGAPTSRRIRRALSGDLQRRELDHP